MSEKQKTWAIGALTATLFCLVVAGVVWSSYRELQPEPSPEPEPPGPTYIVGPSEASVSDLVVLAAGKSAKYRIWDTVPSCPKKRVMEDGKVCVLVFDCPGTYTVLLATSSVDGVVLSKHEIRVRGHVPIPPVPPVPPAPEPDPPAPEPQPQPNQEWSRWAKATVESTISTDARVEQANAIAGQLRSLAAKIAAGGIKNPAEARVELRAANARALGRDAIEWSEFSNRFSDACVKLEEKGDLKSLSQYRKIYIGVASGLEQVKAPAARIEATQGDCGPGGCPT